MWWMTKKAVLFAAGLVLLAGGTTSAAPVDVKVPFPFIVQGKTMPAGQYRVQSDSHDPSVWLIEGENGTHARHVRADARWRSGIKTTAAR